jgi:transcriptional regulator of heat shock response
LRSKIAAFSFFVTWFHHFRIDSSGREVDKKMTVQLNSILNDCLSALQSLLIAKEQFSEGNRSVKRLCERTEIFLSALKSLEDPAAATQKEAAFAGLKSLLQSLKKLLSEIQDFVSQYGQDSLCLLLGRWL